MSVTKKSGIKVLRFFYVLIIALALAATVYVGWLYRPHLSIDLKTSHYKCLNGKHIVTFHSLLNVAQFKAIKDWEKPTKDQMFYIQGKCAVNWKDAIKAGYSEREIWNYIKQNPNILASGVYVPVAKYNTLQAAATIITIWLVGFLITYIVVNLFREIVLVLFFGKKFSLHWLKEFSL